MKLLIILQRLDSIYSIGELHPFNLSFIVDSKGFALNLLDIDVAIEVCLEGLGWFDRLIN